MVAVTVMLPNCSAAKKTSTRSRGAFGDRKVSAVAGTPSTQFLPASVREEADGTWRINLDPALWPVKEGDVIVTDAGQQFVVRTAALKTNPYDPIIDHVRGTAVQVGAAGQEPGGSEFAGVP